MRWTLSLDRRLATQFGLKTAPAQELYSSKHKCDFKSKNLVCKYTWKCVLAIGACDCANTCMTKKAVAVTAVKR